MPGRSCVAGIAIDYLISFVAAKCRRKAGQATFSAAHEGELVILYGLRGNWEIAANNKQARLPDFCLEEI
jgi:hypothetical protein